MTAGPQVLVAYTAADRFAADTVMEALRGAGLAVLPAAGDVTGARALVLLHSRTAAADASLLRIVDAAAASKLPILVVRLDTEGPTPQMKAKLRSVPWLDAANGRLPERLQGIVNRVKSNVGVPLDDAEAVDDGEGGIDLWSVERRRVPPLFVAISIVVVAGIAVLLYRAYDRFAAQNAYDQGVAALADGNLDGAAHALDDAVKRRPTWALAWRQRAFATTDPAAQVTYFTRALALDPADADALAGRARAYLRAGDAASARVDYTAALARVPDSAEWYGERGLASLALGDDAAAANDFARCQALSPRCRESLAPRIAALEAAQKRTPRDWFAIP
ncbi:MAG: hypothetical protein JSR18_10255 [Proteobacteria bacterium]|nr:hypothetical protein [Pseudomonadota bacterium]